MLWWYWVNCAQLATLKWLLKETSFIIPVCLQAHCSQAAGPLFSSCLPGGERCLGTRYQESDSLHRWRPAVCQKIHKKIYQTAWNNQLEVCSHSSAPPFTSICRQCARYITFFWTSYERVCPCSLWFLSVLSTSLTVIELRTWQKWASNQNWENNFQCIVFYQNMLIYQRILLIRRFLSTLQWKRRPQPSVILPGEAFLYNI